MLQELGGKKMNRSKGIIIFSIFAIFLAASVGANNLVLTRKNLRRGGDSPVL